MDIAVMRWLAVMGRGIKWLSQIQEIKETQCCHYIPFTLCRQGEFIVLVVLVALIVDILIHATQCKWSSNILESLEMEIWLDNLHMNCSASHTSASQVSVVFVFCFTAIFLGTSSLISHAPAKPVSLGSNSFFRWLFISC